MPRYDYRCHQCDQVFEVSHSISAGPLKECVLCGGESVQKLIARPMINTLKSSSPTGAKYEKLSQKEVVDMEAAPLAVLAEQEDSI